MASLDSLPADERAVLQLVLQRGRSYDDIARLLSIDRAGVRDRARNALDALGPQTRVPPERRALITDYLLGQLPAQVSDQTRTRLAESPSERAWARIVASELAPLASGALPEIPVEAPSVQPDEAEPEPVGAESEPVGAAEHLAAGAVGERGGAATRAPEREPLTATAPPAGRDPGAASRRRRPTRARPVSRRGGAILLAVVAAAVIAVVIVLSVTGGGNSKHKSAARSSSASSSSSAANVVAQINLVSPTAGSKAAGIALVVKQGNTTGLAVRAQNVPPNTKQDAYAVWLYNSPTDSRILGFVNPGVGANGQLSTAGALPSNAAHYKQLLVTLETGASPKTPGKIVLQGALTGV